MAGDLVKEVSSDFVISKNKRLVYIPVCRKGTLRALDPSEEEIRCNQGNCEFYDPVEENGERVCGHSTRYVDMSPTGRFHESRDFTSEKGKDTTHLSTLTDYTLGGNYNLSTGARRG